MIFRKSRAQRRAEMVPAIARVTTSRNFRSNLNTQFPDDLRELTVVPLLADDTIGYALDRLNEGAGAGVLATIDEYGEPKLWTVKVYGTYEVGA